MNFVTEEEIPLLRQDPEMAAMITSIEAMIPAGTGVSVSEVINSRLLQEKRPDLAQLVMSGDISLTYAMLQAR